jgi:hypothetical protein
MAYTKEERRSYNREWWRVHKKRLTAEASIRHQSNPIPRLMTTSRSRAKKYGLSFTITEADIIPLPAICPVLGIPLRCGTSRSDQNAYSLDRIDNQKGYEPGNVRVISWRANRLKNDMTVEEAMKIAYDLADHSECLGLKENSLGSR